MRPEFIINERGSVFCKFHPKYQNFSENVKDLHNIQEPQLEITKFHETRRIWHEVKTCKTCDHFIQNDCFFSRRKITLIRLRAKLQMYRCKFCGSAIDDVFYILYKKIAGQKYNVKIPLVCCLCYISLRSTNMKKEFKSQFKDYFAKSMGFLLLAFIPGITFFFPSFTDNFPMTVLVIYIFIIFFSVAFLNFIKILKLKCSLKKSEFFKDLLEKVK